MKLAITLFACMILLSPSVRAQNQNGPPGVGASAGATEEGGVATGDLLVTPMIKSGQIEVGRKASANDWSVLATASDLNITSYSGFITLNDESHLFFWFFPSQENPKSAPMILWVNEFPGWSLISGVLIPTAPFQIEENGQLNPRNNAWSKSHSLLYIDCPPGTGFSFSKNEDASANSVIGDEVYQALQQFLVLFPEFQQQELYLAGENNAATFVPSILRDIEGGNQRDDSIKVNLKGLMVGSPFLDIRQFHRAQSFYNLGLLDKHGEMEMEAMARKAEELVRKGKILEGWDLGRSTFYGPDSVVAKYTGFQDTRSLLKTQTSRETTRYEQFFTRPEVLNFLHVSPSRKFRAKNSLIFAQFVKEVVATHSDLINEILEKNYRVLFYAPQLDLYYTLETTVEAVNNLRWSGSETFENAPRTIWKVGDDVAGYVKVSGNFTFVVLRNAGNYAITDQPEWAFEMVERFLHNKPF